MLLTFLLLALPLSRASEIDYLNLTLPALGDHALHVLSPTLLEVTRLNSKPPGVAPVDNWDFVDEHDVFHAPAFSQFAVTVDGLPATVVGVGFKRRPLYAPVLVRDLRIENSLYLELSVAIPDGHIVEVTNPGGALWSADETYIATTDPLRYSPAIHVNQEGYVPGLPKKAMIGYYLGDLGELNVSASVGFKIVVAGTGVSVFQGALTPRADIGYLYTPTPYQKVLEADFSSVTAPGKYQLVVPGLGASLPFAIDEGTAMNFLRTYALGLYEQRCGTDNVMPFTRFVHDACHTAPAEVPWPQANYSFTWSTISSKNGDFATNPRHTAPQLDGAAAQLYPFVNHGVVDVSGGHHDAGDYSKYTINSAALAHLLLFTADAIPGAGALDNLGLPESGDGISDILQEAKQETDYLAKLQDADGGFYFIVYPKEREYESNVLPENGDTQVVWPKNTAATAAAVAVLAQAASSPRFKAAYPAVAALYLRKAKLGWQFLTNAIAAHGKDGSYQKITFYGDDYMHDDELAWAACELFIATGEAPYRQKFFEWFPNPADPATFRFGWQRMSESWGCAIRSYAFAARTGRLQAGQLDPSYLAQCEEQIVAAGDDALLWSTQNAYATSFPEQTKHFLSAGWYFSLDQASDMATAYQISPKASYLEALVGNMNYEAGTNPVNVTYLTGLGRKRQREIVSQYALNDRRVLPPTGIPLGNIQTTFAFLDPYGSELRELVYPSDGAIVAPYEFYDRWADSFNVSTEYIAVNQARSLLALTVLATRTTTQSQPWKSGAAQIITPTLTAPLDAPTTLSVQAPGFDLSSARIVWEARDQEPAFGSTYTISPKNNGQQWVEAEVALPDGRRLFAVNSFNANSATVNWVYGAVPLGATSFASGGDAWTWGPFFTPSGQPGHQSNLAADEHSHWFQNAAATLTVGVGDKLFAWVYLDPLNPPTEVLLSWDDGSEEHRAYWGANTITWGNNNTAGRHSAGALPPLGQWVRLVVAASAVGLEGSTVTGMGFTLVDGRATWDTAGVVSVVPTAPAIVTQPQSRVSIAGDNASFTVDATGTAPLAYRWTRNGVTLSGATTATLLLTAVTAAEAGSYAVEVSNSAGITPSNAAILTVSAASGAPAISVQPVSHAIPVGHSVLFTVTATGAPAPTFQWRKNGEPVLGATAATFGIASVQMTDAGNFDCVITNLIGTTISSAALLTVTPAFTTQPQSQVIAAGSAATFTAAADGAPPLTYQWKRNGLPIAGATAATYSITSAAAMRDNGWYQTVVTSSSGTATSAAFFVNVAVGPTQIVAWGANDEGEAAVPTGLTDAVAIAAGGAHSVALKANGTIVAWGRNIEGQTAVPGNLANVVGLAAGLAHTVALQSDGTVVAWGANDHGQATVPAGLSNVVSVAAGGYHTVALVADGTVVAWGDNSSGQIAVPAGLANVIAIAAGSAHTVALKNDGIVVAWGYNGAGQTVPPSSLTNVVGIAAGYYHTVALKADGSVVAWGWSGYGQAISPTGLSAVDGIGAGGAHTLVQKIDGTVIGWGDNQLGQTAVPVGLGNVLRLAAGGDHTLALRDARILPAIDTPPSGQTVLAGQPVTFSVTAIGTPTPTFQWRRNGVVIGGATSAIYTIVATVAADAGDYAVTITNSAGSVTSAVAPLVVTIIAPSIGVQPVKQQLGEGGTITLSVTATGTTPLSYQWRRNGVALNDGETVSGATTATLTVVAASPSDSGIYSVVVTNGGGTTTSDGVVAGVVPTGTGATHAVVADGYLPGSTLTITNTLNYSGQATGLSWHVLLPDGWSYASSSAPTAETHPAAGTHSLLDWTWTAAPPSPVALTYTLNVPSTATGNVTLAAMGTVALNGVALDLLAQPDPLIVSQITTHSADTDHNLKIDLPELLRLIELYNTRNGTVRTGGYAVDDSNLEDGFVPDPTRSNTTVVTLSNYHSADTDRDGKLGLVELLRVIELYNYRAGTVRTGEYHVQANTEDGFAPGP